MGGTHGLPESRIMETVATFQKVEDAYLFRAFLESEGIGAHVFDENFSQLCWYYTQAIGGVRVVVPHNDLERASDLFRDYQARIVSVPAVTGDAKWWPVVLLLSFLIGGPFLVFGRKAFRPGGGNP